MQKHVADPPPKKNTDHRREPNSKRKLGLVQRRRTGPCHPAWHGAFFSPYFLSPPPPPHTRNLLAPCPQPNFHPRNHSIDSTHARQCSRIRYRCPHMWVRQRDQSRGDTPPPKGERGALKTEDMQRERERERERENKERNKKGGRERVLISLSTFFAFPFLLQKKYHTLFLTFSPPSRAPLSFSFLFSYTLPLPRFFCSNILILRGGGRRRGVEGS